MTIGRTEVVRGEFDSYDGSFETVSIRWWTEVQSTRKETTVEQVRELITKNEITDALGLARFFADTGDCGRVMSEGYPSLVDFPRMFNRDLATVFPRIDSDVLLFVTLKGLGVQIATVFEFWDWRIDLRALDVEKELFWTGSVKDLLLTRNG